MRYAHIMCDAIGRKRMLGKNLMSLVVLTMVFFGACSLASEDQTAESAVPVKTVTYVKTGNPAIDSSVYYMSESSLRLFGLIRSENKEMSVKGNAGPYIGTYSLDVYGPLHDERLVKNRRAAISVYKAVGGMSGTWTLHYGFSEGQLDHSVQLLEGTYGNYAVMIDIPNVTKLYFRVEGSDGTVLDNNGSPYVMAVYDSIVSYKYENGKLTVNYSGPAAGNGAKFHLGWNNWNNVGDYNTYYYDWPIMKNAEPNGYNSASIDIPWWANYVDFAVNLNGLWDNNAGKDFHSSVRPLVDARLSGYWNGKRNYNIYYANGNLNPVKVHYGTDGWQNVGDADMQVSYDGSWNARLNLDVSADTLDLVFTDGKGNWDNNFGQNWSFDVNPRN